MLTTKTNLGLMLTMLVREVAMIGKPVQPFGAMFYAGQLRGMYIPRFAPATPWVNTPRNSAGMSLLRNASQQLIVFASHFKPGEGYDQVHCTEYQGRSR